jgi:dolichol-phosphate mannosyltransferase
MTQHLELSVIMPALNEEAHVEHAIRNTLCAFDDTKTSGEIIVINDGSTDGTQAVVERIMVEDPRVTLVRHPHPCGIGASFWEGVDAARADAVCLLPGDNENDPWEIIQYYFLLEHVDIVIPFVFNREVRPYFRNVLSSVYRAIINTTFMVNFNYTNGTVLWRRGVLRELPPRFRSKGFFFQTDALIRLVKRGYLFAEVPYRLGIRKGGISKAVSFPSFVRVARGYLNLVWDFYSARLWRKRRHFKPDTATNRRYTQPLQRETLAWNWHAPMHSGFIRRGGT